MVGAWGIQQGKHIDFRQINSPKKVRGQLVHLGVLSYAGGRLDFFKMPP